MFVDEDWVFDHARPGRLDLLEVVGIQESFELCDSIFLGHCKIFLLGGVCREVEEPALVCRAIGADQFPALVQDGLLVTLPPE